MMAGWQKLNTTKKSLVILLCATIVFSGYFFLRWQPASNNINAIQKEIRIIKSQETQLEPIAIDTKSLKNIDEKIKVNKIKIGELTAKSKELQASQLNALDSKAITAAKTDIANHASKLNLHIINAQTIAWQEFVNSPSNTLHSLKNKTAIEQKKSVEKIELTGQYQSIIYFIRQLKTIQHSPLICNWHIELNTNSQTSKKNPLLLSMTLVF